MVIQSSFTYQCLLKQGIEEYIFDPPVAKFTDQPNCGPGHIAKLKLN